MHLLNDIKNKFNTYTYTTVLNHEEQNFEITRGTEMSQSPAGYIGIKLDYSQSYERDTDPYKVLFCYGWDTRILTANLGPSISTFKIKDVSVFFINFTIFCMVI